MGEFWESLGLLLHKEPQEKTSLALLNSPEKHQEFDVSAKGPSQSFADSRVHSPDVYRHFVCTGR